MSQGNMSSKIDARFTGDELLKATSALAVRTLSWPLRSEKNYGLSTDSRTLKAGDWYLPLLGESFDGHDFLDRAFAQGAGGAFVAEHWLKKYSEWKAPLPVIVVSDTTETYLALAQWHRRRMGATILALTGSSGKTTTKEMLFTVFSSLLPTQCTQKNFNNEVGVSQTLLSIQPETQLMIVEMGMRGLGEIALLSRYAEPDMALIINVGSAHIGRLGSLENIAQAKCEIFEGMDPATGVAILNGDDARLMETAQLAWSGEQRVYSLAEAENRTLFANEKTSFCYCGKTFQLSVPGDHMIANALAVIKVGERLELPLSKVAKGLAQFVPSEGRGKTYFLEGFQRVRVVNDAYNANPESVRASLSAFLQGHSGDQKRFLILGGMKELDARSETEHQKLGQWLGQQKGIDALFLVGDEAPWVESTARKSADYPIQTLRGTPAEMAKSLLESLQTSGRALENCNLYLKGSRVYALEKIPEAFLTP